jgi:hypothetical protein
MRVFVHVEPFEVTGLSARAGLSTVSAFFLADHVVLCDLGAAGVLRSDGWRSGVDVADWCEETQKRARRVEVVPDGEICGVRVVYSMMQHKLWIARDTGGAHAVGYRGVRRATPRNLRYTLLERAQTEYAVSLLSTRFGGRFELTTTRVYSFVHRVAPVLTR